MRRKKEADSFFTKVATTEEGFGKTTFAGCQHRNRWMHAQGQITGIHLQKYKSNKSLILIDLFHTFKKG